MSSTFTPSTKVVDAGEKDWGYQIGILDWDSTSIVFTKRSLIEFLKYAGTTVDTNFNSIQKLPRYATFGKLTSADGSAPGPAAAAASTAPSSSSSPSSSSKNQDTVQGVVTSDGNRFKPSRRVRDAPGGAMTDIFDNSDLAEEVDAISASNRRNHPVSQIMSDQVPQTYSRNQPEPQAPSGDAPKPSRRVRDMPGGQSSMGSLWETDDTEAFKPTRRVREGPGGHDNINGIF